MVSGKHKTNISRGWDKMTEKSIEVLFYDFEKLGVDGFCDLVHRSFAPPFSYFERLEEEGKIEWRKNRLDRVDNGDWCRICDRIFVANSDGTFSLFPEKHESDLKIEYTANELMNELQ